MENGNTRNGGMTVLGDGNQNLSSDSEDGSIEEVAGPEVVAGNEPEVVTCMETEEGLELGMEVCTYDSMGMGLECDEEILTASSLERVANSMERSKEGDGGRERSLPFNSPQNRRSNSTSPDTQHDLTPSPQPQCLTLSDPQENFTLSSHCLQDYKQFSADQCSSAINQSSQLSQSDSTYCQSHASSMTSSTSDIGVTEEEEVGGATEDTSSGGRWERRKRGGRREGKKVKRGSLAVGIRQIESKVFGDPTVLPSRVQRRGTLQRRKAVMATEADSSDSSEITAEDDPSSQRSKGKRSSLLLQSSQSPCPPPPKKTKLPPDQPPGNLLGSILTDIPEIDIRPILSRKIPPKKETERGREKNKPRKKERTKHNSNQSQPSDKNSKPGSPPASAHYRILMSWERDYSLGLNATRAPILFALENMHEKLRAVKGGWMNRAKLIWTTWRRTSVAKRDGYCERAKQNRLKLKEKAAVVEKSGKRCGQPTGDTKRGKTRPKSTKTAPLTPKKPPGTTPSKVDDETAATTAFTSSDKEPVISPSKADNKTKAATTSDKGSEDKSWSSSLSTEAELPRDVVEKGGRLKEGKDTEQAGEGGGGGEGDKGGVEKEKAVENDGISSGSCKLPTPVGRPDPSQTGQTNGQRVSEHISETSDRASVSSSRDSLTFSCNPTLSLPPSPPPSLHFYGSSLLSSPLSRTAPIGFPLAVSPLSPPFLPLPFPYLSSSSLLAATTSHAPSTTTQLQESLSSSSMLSPTTSTTDSSEREANYSVAKTTSSSGRAHGFLGMGEAAANPFIRDIINPFGTRDVVSTPTKCSTEGSRHSLSLSLHREQRPNSQTPPNSHQTTPTMFSCSAPLFSQTSILPRWSPTFSYHSPSSSSSFSSTSVARKQRSNSDSATYGSSARLPPPRTRSNSSGVSRAFPRRQHVSDSSLPGARSFPRLPLSRGSNSNYTTRQLSPELLSYSMPSSSSLSSLSRSNFSLPSSVVPLTSPSTPSLFTSKPTSLFPSLPPHSDKANAPVLSSEIKRYKSSRPSTTLNPFPTRLGSKTIPHYAVAGDSSTQPISTNFSRATCSQANFSRANPQNFSCASSSTPPIFGSSAAITRECLFLPMNSFIPSFSSFYSSNQSPNLPDNRAPQNNGKNQFGSEEGARESSDDHTAGYKQERSNLLTPKVAQHTFTHNLGGPLDVTRNSQPPSFPAVPSISRMPPTKHPRPHSLLASARDIGGTKKRCASFGSSTQNLLPHSKPSQSRSQSTSSFSVFRMGALSLDSFSLPPSFSAQDKIIGQGMGSLIPTCLELVIPQLPTELKRTGSGLTTPSDAPINLGGPPDFTSNSSTSPWTPSFPAVPSISSTQLPTKTTSTGVISTVISGLSTTPGAVSGLSTTPGAVSGLSTTPGAVSGLSTTPGAVSGLSTTPGAVSGLSTTPGAVSGLSTTPGAVSGLSTTPGAVSGLSTTPGAVSGLSTTPGAVSGLSTTPGAVYGLFTTPGAVSGLSTTLSAVSGLSTTPGAVSGLSTTPGAVSGLPSKPSSISKRKPQTSTKIVAGKVTKNRVRKTTTPSKRKNSKSAKPAAKNRKKQFSNSNMSTAVLPSLPHPFSMFPMSPPTSHTPISHSTRLESGHRTPNTLTPPTPFGLSPIQTTPILPGILPPTTNPQTGQPGIIPGQPSLNGSLHQTLAYWELERLYYHNLALLEQQRQYTLFLEAELRKMEQACQNEDHGNRVVAEQQPSYQQFWGCVGETEYDASASPAGSEGCGLNSNDVTAFVETSNSGLCLRPEHDYYGSLLNQCGHPHDSKPLPTDT